MLVIAVVLELFRHRWAAPLGLAATTLLWLHFGPGLLARVAGNAFYTPAGAGYGILIAWQQFAYQIGASVSAAALTYIRYFRRGAS